ncbi:MAG: hypothetical protein HN413_07080 [Chloroflexi bacterium]|jgi:hypothetical protein|nr:hypothetical protein [Chloroflexota bacterium]
MEAIYHSGMLTKTLSTRISPAALETMIAANLNQDRLLALIGHDEYHFDSNAFEAGYAYMEAQRQIVQRVLQNGADITAAWQAFGRLTHAAQDFYAHSNYVYLWRDQFNGAEALPTPSGVPALDEVLLTHPELHSGRIYFGEALIYLLPFFTPWVYPRLPEDSHAKMNLDYPERGELFPYAIAAAEQRTIFEFELLAGRVTAALGKGVWKRFING